MPTPSDVPLSEGCELIREIGHGADGTVYLARKGGEWLALKRMERTAENAERFDRERRGVQTVMRLPPVEGLVRIRDCADSTDGNSFAYTMDLADGESGEPPSSPHYRPRSLASVIDAEIALPLSECLAIGIRIARALEHLQRHHVVHRDIKPGNILFFRGKAVLADVGLLADARETASIVGTPGYAPPERQGSAGGDVFGLGKTLWRISTGRPPEDASLPPCAEAEVESPLFWQWLALLAKATARDPARRHRSAKALRKDLIRLRRRNRMRRFRLLKIAAVLLAAVLIAPVVWHFPMFRIWCLQDDEYRFHMDPPGPWRLVKPFFAPKEDPMVSPGPWHWDALLKETRKSIDESIAAARQFQEEAEKNRLESMAEIRKRREEAEKNRLEASRHPSSPAPKKKKQKKNNSDAL